MKGWGVAAICALQISSACNRGNAEPASDAKSPPQASVIREATAEEVEALHARIENAIHATAELSAPILTRGEIARVAIDENRVAVVPIDEAEAEHIARVIERDDPEDVVSPRWFRRHGAMGRLFVTIDEGAFLINFDPARGFSVEPGS